MAREPCGGLFSDLKRAPRQLANQLEKSLLFWRAFFNLEKL
jgi:hypothetical protein